jgi:hypothetical protein
LLSSKGGGNKRLTTATSVVSGSNVGVLSHGVKLGRQVVWLHIVNVNIIEVVIRVAVGFSVGLDKSRLESSDTLGIGRISGGAIDGNVHANGVMLISLDETDNREKGESDELHGEGNGEGLELFCLQVLRIDLCAERSNVLRKSGPGPLCADVELRKIYDALV